MGFFGDIINIIGEGLCNMLEPRDNTHSTLHIGITDPKTGKYNHYQTGAMFNTEAEWRLTKQNREYDAMIARGEMRAENRPEIWAEPTRDPKLK